MAMSANKANIKAALRDILFCEPLSYCGFDIFKTHIVEV